MIKFNEVTWYSKLAAVLFFLAILPVFTFYIGMQYKEVQQLNMSAALYQSQDAPASVPKPKNEDVTAVSKKVLTALRNKDYAALEALSSSDGLVFEEYPNLDFTKSDITKERISDVPTDTQKRLFGYTDGKGDPIFLTTAEYVEKWIYNHDYLNAPETAVDKVLGSGNSLNTLMEKKGNRTMVAFHFEGFKPEFEGMDWTTLYLVFDIEGGEYKLRGIAKDNWTI